MPRPWFKGRRFNFFWASEELAEHWADQHRIAGRVLALDEASDLATAAWSAVV